MNRDLTQHPEFRRAQALIEEAVAEIHAEGGDLASFASVLLSQSSALYALTNGTSGPEGLPAVLGRLAAVHTTRGETLAAMDAYGNAGRA